MPDPPKVTKVFVHLANSCNYDDYHSIPHPFKHEYWKDSLDVTPVVLQLCCQDNLDYIADFTVLPNELAIIRDPLQTKHTCAIPPDYDKLVNNLVWAPIYVFK